MKLPLFHTCLVCEAVRPELRGLNIVLGLFGALPHVGIAVQDFSKPATLTFLLLGTSGEGKFRFEAQILDETAVALEPKVPLEFEFFPKFKGAALSFVFQNLTLPKPGTYSFVLSADGKEVYRGSFWTQPPTGEDQGK
jgi:uncharacterized protein DUF6941